MIRRLLFTLALPSLVFACAATTDVAEEDDEATDEQAYTSWVDVSASYVGAYTPAPGARPGEVTSLRLRKDRSFVLVQNGATEQGLWTVKKGGAVAELRLTVASGARKTFRVTLGDGFRPRLALTRSRKTSELERAPVSCESVTCTTGMGCDVVDTDGVPGPVCNVRAPAWKTALAGYDLWGATFSGLWQLSYGAGSRGVSCGIRVSASTITCGTVGWDGWAVTGRIADDGTILGGTREGDGNYIAGRIDATGAVTLDAWRKKECYTVPSGTFCDKKEAGSLPKTAKPYEMCRTPDQTFQSGGWASGYYLECSECTPERQCIRYPAP